MSGIIPRLGGREPDRAALVSMPHSVRRPARELLMRAGVGLMLLLIVTVLVWLDRDAYRDANGDGISLLDAIYYSTVTVTTTGYGDITPITPGARAINAVVITPLRIIFLVLLVGTTLEVLSNEVRRAIVDNRWRRRMRNHVVIVGYGVKGRSAVQTLTVQGHDRDKMVVIDPRPHSIEDANLAGLAAIQGDATHRDVLRRAEISKAKEVIITVDRDDSAILVTLMTRQLSPSAHIVVAGRESENVSLLRQSGADSVVTSSDMVGRLLGLSAVSPNIGIALEDILSSGVGLEVSERQVTADEVGRSPSDITHERVVAVVRNKTMRRYYDPSVAELETGDNLVIIRKSENKRAAAERAERERRNIQ